MQNLRLQIGAIFASAIVCLSGAPALAQGLEPPRSVGVQDRERPEYQPYGMQIGSFTALPEITLSETADDNIYATQSNKINDTYFDTNARIELQSDWARNAMSLYADLNSLFYSKNSQENYTNWDTGASLNLDVTHRLAVKINGSYSLQNEPRDDPSSPVGTISPVQYGQTDAGVSISGDLDPVRLTLTTNYTNFNFQNAELPGNVVLLEDFRDRDVWSITGRSDIKVSANTSAFVEIIGTETDYRLAPPVVALNRNSNSVSVLTGAQFDLTKLIRGEIGVGYFDLNNRDPSQNDLSGLTVDSRVQWLATQLITVTVFGTRKPSQSDITGSASAIENNVGGKVDYELLRDLILSAGASYDKPEYTGIDRKDSGHTETVEANWLINRHATFTVNYTHETRKSSGTAPGQDFTQGLVTAALRLAL